MKLSSKLFTPSAALLLVTLGLLSLLYLQHKFPFQWFVNADVLSYPLFIKGVILDGMPYHSWYPSTGVYLFPNMLLVAVSLILTNWNIYYANLVAVLIQFALFYVVLNHFFRTLLGSKYSQLLTPGLLILLVTYNITSPDFLIAIVNYGFHTFVFIFSLIILSLFCKDLENRTLSWSRISLAFVISILCASSDSIYLAWLILPLSCTLAYLWITGFISRKLFLAWLVSFVLSVPLGFWLQKIITPLPLTQPRSLSFSAIHTNLDFFIKMFTHIGVFSVILSVVAGTFFCLIAVFFVYGMLYRRARLIRGLDPRAAYIIGFNFFLLTSLVSESFLITPLHPTSRYFLSLFIMAFISILTLSMLYLKNTKVFTKLLGAMSIVCLLFLIFKVFFPLSPLKSKYTASPAYTCIIKVLKKHHLKNGISGYWDSKPLMFFAQEAGLKNLSVASYAGYLTPFRWLTFEGRFKSKYSFAVYNKNTISNTTFTPKDVIKLSGQPEKIIYCGQYEIMLYKPNKLNAT